MQRFLIQKMKKIIYTQNKIQQVAQQIIAAATSKTLCFYGEMGAGKTTLIKALVQKLGGDGTVNSPTFGIVNEYYTKDGELLGHHFDFYRLNHETEALDMGLEDYLSSGGWIFMEWPEKIPSLLPADTMDIYIEILDPTTRRLRLGKDS